MKKIIALLMAMALVFSLAACGGNTDGTTTTAAAGDAAETKGVALADLKVGFIYVGDENEGYTESHMKGKDAMIAELGLSADQVLVKTNIPESDACYEAAVDLAEQGCNIIFANSFGHEDHMIRAAKEYPEVQFCHATGYQAASAAAEGTKNIHNYFTSIYEARYVSGIVAGMKLASMIEAGDITADEAKVGYVGAYSYAEVVSGFTSFFLGIRAMCPSATMEVKYTGSWADMAKEKECAEALIADGCVLIGQHADTTGAPSACEVAGVPCVGYNVSMINTAPKTALTSSTNNWAPYITYAVNCILNGEEIPTDWCKGYVDGAVSITELNNATIVDGTTEKVAEVEAALKAGTLHVFDTSTWTKDGKTLTTYTSEYGVEYISDGYFHESEYASAPSFDIIIDGITELNTAY